MIVEATAEEAERMLAPNLAAMARADVTEFVASGKRVCRVELPEGCEARLVSAYATYRRAALGAGVEARRDDGRIFLVRPGAGQGAR